MYIFKSSEYVQCTSATSVITAWQAFTCSLSTCVGVLKVTPLEKMHMYLYINQTICVIFGFSQKQPNMNFSLLFCYFVLQIDTALQKLWLRQGGGRFSGLCSKSFAVVL